MAQRVKYLCVVVFLGFIMCLMGLLRANSDGRSDVIVYDPNELTWGPVYRGLAISICPNRLQYALGEDIEVRIYLKNLRSEEFSIRYSTHQRLYRMAMFDSEGAPVERTEELRNSEASLTKPGLPTGRFSMRGISVSPWEESTRRDAFRIVYLKSWFKIDKPGTYALVVMHPIASGGLMEGPSWEEGFLISNAIKINIVER